MKNTYIRLKQEVFSRFAYPDYVRRAHRLTPRTLETPRELQVPMRLFDYPLDIVRYAAENFPLRNAQVCEFGVYQGATLRTISRIVYPSWVFAFDWFKGLQDSFAGYTKGRLAINEPPPMPENSTLICGDICDTAYLWAREHRRAVVGFINLDCNVFAPIFAALNALRGKMAAGTWILFDDMYGYEGWEGHSWRALQASGIQWKPIGRCINERQLLIEVCESDH